MMFAFASRRLAFSVVVVVCGAVSLNAFSASAQFPARPIRLVVPYPPGGANDNIARLIAPKLTEQLGYSVVVDNRGGGNTIIGSELVAKAAPDGHTILMIAAGHAINPSLYRSLPYNTVHDFAPVSLIGDGAYVLVAHPSLGVSSVSELIVVEKARPGEITYASSSIGNLTHLAAEVFNAMAAVKTLHVPYKGGGPAMVDLLGGRVAIFFSTVAVARPHLQSGKIKGLGVTTARRTAALPSMPTIAEAGLPGYDVSGWYGLVAPARTPPGIIARLHSVITPVLRQPDVREKLLSSGVDVVEMSSAQFGSKISSEVVKWEKIVKPLNITPE
jgi:tripartite-type tricarboxylate transporter receptor subunit TctC